MEDLNQPATKGDIVAMKEDVALLRSEMNYNYRDVVERIADSQTKLLKAIEDRILEVERRLNIPPAAA